MAVVEITSMNKNDVNLRFTRDAWDETVGSEKKKEMLTKSVDELKLYMWVCNWFMLSVVFLETINITLLRLFFFF